MSSLKKVNESAKFAVNHMLNEAARSAANHMPMKTYPALTVKRYRDLDAEEREYAARTLGINVNELLTKDFYAYLSVTVSRKEFTYLATANAPDKAVRRCFAESLTFAVDKRKLFSVLADFCQHFNNLLELNM